MSTYNEESLRWRLLWIIARHLQVSIGSVARWNLSTYEMQLLEGEALHGLLASDAS